MKDIAEVLGSADDEGGEFDEYSMYVDDLAAAFGISRDKAEKAAAAICGLARYEVEQGSGYGPEKPKHHGGGKPNIALILGG